MKKTVTILLATLLTAIVGCAGNPVSSMRGTDVAAGDPAPKVKQYAQRLPDANPDALIPRTFQGQPPLVPHATEKYLPITVSDNACLDCHIDEEFKGRKMPRIGKSHFSPTLKEADGSAAVAMSRWQCNTCHVEQVDAPPLVENTFVGQK